MAKNSFALIMAGGQGTRFWPWSTAELPKQFLPVLGELPLITQTFNRLKRIVPPDHIYVVADRRYLKAVQRAIPGFAEHNFIAEPSPRNTAPCLIMANLVLAAKDPQATLLVSPADHFIAEETLFATQLQAALEKAQERCLVTAGVVPTSPHTGYGYIQFDPNSAAQIGESSFYDVIDFREKPDSETARHYLAAGRYFWNSGMFIYKLSHFKEFLSVYAPDYFRFYEQLSACVPGSSQFNDLFNKMKADSIDYVLMEKMREIRMMKAEFGWNDVGSWSSVYEAGPCDERGNVKRGRTVLLDTSNSLAFTTGSQPIALIGLNNVAVIATENGIVVANRDELQRIKEILPKLKAD